MLVAQSASITFNRADWMDFRELDRITTRAGVAMSDLPRIVVKELCDNALDASGAVTFGLLPTEDDDALKFFIANDGAALPGDDNAIAELYSIRRPMSSTKLVRRPTRGMLGNGLRVVAGVVLVTGGALRVRTNGRSLTLRPCEQDGCSRIACSEPWDGAGTRVEVTLRGELARLARDGDYDLFEWANQAVKLAAGQQFKGKSSPRWYDANAFWHLLQNAGEISVRHAVRALFAIPAKGLAELVGPCRDRACKDLAKSEASELWTQLCTKADEMPAARLGRVGKLADYAAYKHRSGCIRIGTVSLPYVVEVWANRSAKARATMCINRTPVCAEFNIFRQADDRYASFGCELEAKFPAGRKRYGDFVLLINIICPFVRLTSSGKDPDLAVFRHVVSELAEQAVKQARRQAPARRTRVSQKELIMYAVPAAQRLLSGDGQYLFSLRQLFYHLRPELIRLLGREPQYSTFGKIVGNIEDRTSEIEGLYRDDRGRLLHPHTRANTQMGTRAVANYRRPDLTFRSLLFCEKEGLFPLLEHVRWPERFDCALASTKGFATRAATRLIQLLKNHPDPITVFVIHDADGPGTVIFEALQNSLAATGVEVVNLGLEPAEARAMGLEIEPVTRKKIEKRVAVAKYVPARDQEWLQHNRCELNAMTTEQFIQWLSDKVSVHYQSRGLPLKVVPDHTAISGRLHDILRSQLHQKISARVLAEANIDQQVVRHLAALEPATAQSAPRLAAELPPKLMDPRPEHWTTFVDEDAAALVAQVFP